MKKIVFLLAICLLPVISVWAENIAERPDWKKYFDTAGVEGCFLFYDLSSQKYSGYNLKRIKQEFLPASTFKFFSSLVALETGVVGDVDENFKWDGVDRQNPAWNRDQTLRHAYKNSTLWFYQELVRRIGEKRMQNYVNRAGYGNRQTGGGSDRFWLDGGLMRITPRQQIEFLVKLYKYELPFSRRTIDAVKDISIFEKTEKFTIHGKMGWAVEQKVAWLVGYVERGDKAYFFAMNISAADNKAADARVPVTQKILQDLRVID